MDNKAVIEEGKKRFQQILEFTYRGYKGDSLLEDDPNQDNQQDMPQDGGAPMGDASMPQDGGNMPPMGGDNGMPQDGGAPMGDASMPQDGGNMPPMGGDASMPQDGGMPQGQVSTPEGLNPQEMPDDGSADVTPGDFEGGQPGPDDDVVDISDLTDSQESTEDAVKEVSGKFDKVMKYLGQWEELIKANNEKIEDLKAEYERRNPTQIEKLSMQTNNSYPFNVTPEEYWKEKEATSNYRTEDDDNGKEQGQYTITKKDVDGDVNWKGIADSLDEDMYHQTLQNTMKV